MKKFIAAVLFLLMLACAALARHRPLPCQDAGTDSITEIPSSPPGARSIHHQHPPLRLVFLVYGGYRKPGFAGLKKNFKKNLKKKASSFCLHLDMVVLTHKL